MNDQDFAQWVSAHVISTGCDAARVSELLFANRESLVVNLHATFEELCECTQRLFETGRVPQFPSEHPNAIVKELKAYRAETSRREESKRLIGDGATACERRPDCIFRGICCGGRNWPDCQEVQKRWDLKMKEIQPTGKKKAKR